MGLLAPIVTEISYIAPNSCFNYFLSSAHALYLENYDGYDIGVFGNQLISTNLPGVGVIRFTLRSLSTLFIYLKVKREQLKSGEKRDKAYLDVRLLIVGS